ncbi:MAG: VWA domain-containing protein, partial [Acidobacteria bacterium]|nr:VWA domain-containing protein [Acidobacteriota bacterium]
MSSCRRVRRGQRTRRCRSGFVALGAWLLLAAGAARAQNEISVTLDRPNAFEPAFGKVQVEAVVVAQQPIERVVFYVDGLVVGETQGPPHEVSVDLGEDVDSHDFFVVAYGADGSTGSSTLTTPGMRIDEKISIRLQQLYVTVTGQDGERVLDLQPDRFRILEAGEPQERVTFARGDIPFTAVVMLDSSASMAGEKLRAALSGARAFFEGMKTLDEGKLVVFSDRVLHRTPFTTFPEVLTAGLDRVRASGGTALNDHLYLSLKQLEQRQGRRVVILLSDGIDSHSVLSASAVAAVARRSQALVYWLRLPYRPGAPAGSPPSLTTSWRSSAEYAREYESLGRTVEESGGRILDLDSVDGVGAAFREILEERGIEVTGKTKTGVAPESAEPLAWLDSPPLTTILMDMNKYSSNFMAEQVLRAVGAKAKGAGTTAAGVVVMREYLDSLGLDPKSYSVFNGSGLSRDGSIP